jgi:hypothetical protein
MAKGKFRAASSIPAVIAALAAIFVPSLATTSSVTNPPAH